MYHSIPDNLNFVRITVRNLGTENREKLAEGG